MNLFTKDGFITKDGLNNIHLLINLKSLYLSNVKDNWLPKLSKNTALTHLNLGKTPESKISVEGISHLPFLFRRRNVETKHFIFTSKI
jgi:hypothetical protein